MSIDVTQMDLAFVAEAGTLKAALIPIDQTHRVVPLRCGKRGANALKAGA